MEKDHLEIILEDINEKFDLVLEGHASLHKKIDTVYQDLSEKIEMNSFGIDTLNKKIDGVAADLAAHRADTESHSKGYKVSD
jgi:hypothetical protein